jgi:hypothetical protein
MDTNKKTPKNAVIFNCDKCTFTCFKKSDWNRHITRPKHLNLMNPNEKTLKNADAVYTCECKKQYKHMSSLCAHKKKCNYKSQLKDNFECEPELQLEDETPISNDMILELVKQNQEFKELLIEQNKQLLEQNKQIIELSKNSSVTNNNITNNKNKFNLQFFLNEKCKDAVNLMDFVNDLQIQLTDLENVGRLGYTEGISKIFINGLKQLDVSKRPIHCSDYKREVLYIKDQDTWEKENEENKKIKKAIHHISHKNIQQIQKWTDNHPNCKESDSKQNDQYMQILCESMGSAEPANLEKVIRNIAKEVVIDK